MGLVIGADIGGTSTKIAVADDSGKLLSYTTGPGGNLRSSTGDVAVSITNTLNRALDGLPANTVRAGHLGVAGAGPAQHAVVDRLCRTVWADAGLTAPVVVQTDLEIAFASAADGMDGLLLLAGTGAVGCALSGLRTIGRSDGMGWLLGDVGSAVWIGLRALEATAAALDHRGPGTTLTVAVLKQLNVAADPDPRQGLIAAVYPRAVADHGRLAPLVVTAAADGDAIAQAILDEAVAGLLTCARGALTDANVDHPAEIVLAGSLLTTPGPIRAAVRPALAELLGVAESAIRQATTPVVGALRLAAEAAGFAPLDRGALSAAINSSCETPAGLSPAPQ